MRTHWLLLRVVVALLADSSGNWKTRLSLLFFGGMSGALYSLSIPSSDIDLLAWICLVPSLLFGLRVSRNPLTAGHLWWLGLTCGFTAGIGRVYWIAETLVNFGELNYAQVGVTTVGLILFVLAPYTGFFFLICRWLPVNSPVFSWLAAAVWVLFDWVQSWLATGFPWQQIGYSQHGNLPILQLASVTGVYGLSFIVVLVNVVCAQVILVPRLLLRSAGPVFVAMVVVVAFGYYRLATLPAVTEPPYAQIAIVQGNVAQDLKWKFNAIPRITDHHLKLARDLVSGGDIDSDHDLIVFPETAMPFYFTDPVYSKYQAKVSSLARELDTPIVVGSLGGSVSRPPFSPPPIYNRAFLIDRNGVIVDFVDKVHLVPFGEYLPMTWLFGYLQEFTREVGQITPADSHRVIDVPDTDFKLGVFVCYESIFPGITRFLVEGSANILINITNDIWFGHSSGAYQHMAMTVVRAVESGSPLVRAANTGISGAVSPWGHILAATPIFETAAISVNVPAPVGPTLYVRYGDVFLVLCGCGLALAAGLFRCRN